MVENQGQYLFFPQREKKRKFAHEEVNGIKKEKEKKKEKKFCKELWKNHANDFSFFLFLPR